MYEICSKVTRKNHYGIIDVVLVSLLLTLNIALVFLLLSLNKKVPAGLLLDHAFSHFCFFFRISYIPAFIAEKQIKKQLVELENESSQTSASKAETLPLSNHNFQGSLSPMPKLVYPEPRTVEVIRDEEYGLGISIVGGRQDENDQKLKGIFIKHVLETTPAGKSGLLKTGDQILEVRYFI